ncbi:class I SAM-dependent RNA methyltransferase [Hyphococcus sp.]|uniref:class I SAM-dependent RNA methyltransferase n=1 Tax=Hyphococcus sp. TaxID=2038636 RepID=UPI002083EC20|nr:MAG: RNA methyltransferase [Marinicaulis sp.]
MAQQRRHKKRARRIVAKVEAREAEIRIDNIGARGDGVAFVDGAKIFSPLTAPGDLARIAYRGDRGEVITLIEKSPHRAEPVCIHYGDCGGCGLQHVSEAFYRDWKHGLVVDALAREGFDSSIVTPLKACAPATRRRASFAVRKTAAGLVMGFNARASARIISIAQCKVLTPELEQALPDLRDLASATPLHWCKFDLNVTQCDNGLDVVFSGSDADEDLSGRDIEQLTQAARSANIIRLSITDAATAMFETPMVRFGGVSVAVPPGGFLQASHEGEAALAAFVFDHASSAKRIADLFSGCGTFSLPLAACAAVDAFDSDGLAIAALDSAARSAGLRYPLKPMQRNLFDRPLSTDELNVYDAVVFDPPRAGARAQSEQLAQSKVKRVIGVSCNPASFARDAAILRDGGYHLSQVLPVDQFVFSPHVELAGLFIKG